MRTIKIDIRDTYRVYYYDEYHIVEDVVSRMVDQFTDQGMKFEDIKDAIEFALENIFEGEE